jgi:hypothetical protein
MRLDIALKSDRGSLGYEAAKDGKIHFRRSNLYEGLTLLPGRELVVWNEGGRTVFATRDREVPPAPPGPPVNEYGPDYSDEQVT